MISWTLVFLFLLVPIIEGTPSKRLEFDDEPSQNEVTVSVVYDDHSKTLQLKSGLDSHSVAHAIFKNTMNSTGWSLLKVYTNGDYDDHLQAQAAGLAEGFITAEQISMDWQNTVGVYCDDGSEFCDKLHKFLSDLFDWIQSQINENPTDSYWYQVSLIIKQVKALAKGYEQAKMQPILTEFDLLFLNSGSDLGDIEQALRNGTTKKVKGSGSCSALVKLFDENKELAISHVTWNDYLGMLRIYKFYNLSFHTTPSKDSPLIPGQVSSFSSYPGLVYSGDDFHILSSGLVSQETTIDNSNPDLWKYITSSTVLEWIRVSVANRLANDGGTWCSLFERHNSGTYNNQWMILDFKLFEPEKPLRPNTFWVLEQLPGDNVKSADMTELLEKQRYWASYNIPYFPKIYNMSGTAAEKKKYGSFFDYHDAPRAQIFKRDQKNVVDMQSLVKLMRYNNYRHDEFSRCNCTPPYSAENGISARCDLNPANGSYSIPALGHRRHGGTDVKATNSVLAKKYSQFVAAGPTFDQQPPFQWSKTEWKKPLGHPDLFKFEPRLLNWDFKLWDEEPDMRL